MAIILDTDQQEVTLYGGTYIISTFLNGGTASIDVQQQGSTNWASAGTLTTEPQLLEFPRGGQIRLTKTGAAVVELSR